MWEVARDCQDSPLLEDCVKAIAMGLIDMTPYGGLARVTYQYVDCMLTDKPKDHCPKLGDAVRARQAQCRTAAAR